MTVSANSRRREYAGNGVTTVFNGPMTYDRNEIQVFLVTGGDSVPVPQGDFTVTRVGRDTGVTVTMSAAPGVGQTLVILRTVQFVQDVDITNQGAFLPETIEKGYDQVVFQTQQLADGVSRAIRLPDALAVAGISTELPAPVGLRPLVWNVDGTALENGDASLTGDMLLRGSLADAQAGASLVAYRQLGSGAIPRTVSSKLSDVVSVKDFGAIGNDVFDCRAAFQAAVDATPNYGSLYIPAGIYVLSGPITMGNKCITIYGAGFLCSVLRFSSGTSGFVITNTSPPQLDESYTVTIRDLWIFTNNRSDASTAKAIHYFQPAPGVDGGQAQISLLVQNCYFSGIFKFDEWWPYAVYAENAPNVLIDRCFYQGQANRCKGDAFYAKGKSDVMVVRDSQVLYSNSAVTQESNNLNDFGSEALIVKGTGIDDCNFGVRKLHQNASGIGEPLLEVIGCQITTRGIGIYSVNAFDISIHDCLMYLQGSALDPILANATCIRLDRTPGSVGISGFSISQCGFTELDVPAGGGTGIYTKADGGNIFGNRFKAFSACGVQVDGANTYVSRGNTFSGISNAVINSSGGAVTDQRLVTMPPTGFPLDDGVGTPSFGNNLLENSYFESATGWTLGTGWTIASGAAAHASGTTSRLSRPISLLAGVRYRIEIQFGAYAGGGGAVGFSGGTTAAKTVPAVLGTQVLYVTANPGNTTFFFESDATGTPSISSISVRAVNN